MDYIALKVNQLGNTINKIPTNPYNLSDNLHNHNIHIDNILTTTESTLAKR